MAKKDKPKPLVQVSRPPPIEPIGGWRQVITVPAGGKLLHVWPLCRRVSGLYTHWLKNLEGKGYVAPHTSQDPASPSGCLACDQGSPKRWKGYLPVLIYETPRTAILELPHGCSQYLQGLLNYSLPGLGSLFCFSRAVENKKNSAILTVATGRVREEPLPDAFDPIPHVLHMWGAEQWLNHVQSIGVSRDDEKETW